MYKIRSKWAFALISVYFPRYIEPLVTQCMEWCDNYTLPLLVPLTTWLDNVHTPLVTSMSHDIPITCAALIPNGQHVILAADSMISMLHIATRRQVKTFKGKFYPKNLLTSNLICVVQISDF